MQMSQVKQLGAYRLDPPLPAEVNTLVCGEHTGFWATGLWTPDREHPRRCLVDNRVELGDFSYIGFYLLFDFITTSIT